MGLRPGILALAAVLLAVGAATSRAQQGEIDADPCSGIDDVTGCWSREAERADAEMNAAYAALLGRLRGDAAERLRKSQRLWLAFREAHLSMLYAAAEATQRTQAQTVGSLGARAERLTCAAIARRQLAVARARALALLLEPALDEGCPL